MRDQWDVQAIVSAIKSVVPDHKERLPLHEPVFKGNEWSYVKECIDTGWVSSVGKYVDRFEELLREFTGVKHAVAVANGTAALHICLKLAGVEPDDEVLIPALTFIATANAVSYCGAVPHFVDSSTLTLGMDPFKLHDYLREVAEIKGDSCFNRLTGRRIKAAVPMHTFGHPVDVDPLLELCEQYNVTLIEDAAESLGSYYKGKHTGHWGKLSALSFNGNKIVTTGGGGAILTNDDELGRLAKHLTTTAKVPHRWAFVHDAIGYNYRMPNINAALGCAQLENLPRFIAEKRALTKAYQRVLATVVGVKLFLEPPFAQSNYWLQVLLLDEPNPEMLEKLLAATNDLGIMTRPVWTLLNRLPMYRSCPSMELPVAEMLEKQIINIPSSAYLGENYV